jgi:hypothetical protein
VQPENPGHAPRPLQLGRLLAVQAEQPQPPGPLLDELVHRWQRKYPGKRCHKAQGAAGCSQRKLTRHWQTIQAGKKKASVSAMMVSPLIPLHHSTEASPCMGLGSFFCHPFSSGND